MGTRDCSRAIGTLLRGSLEQRIMASLRSPLSNAHHAVMLSISTTAGRHVRFSLCVYREERRDKWQAEHSQQKNGEKSTQCFD